MTTSMTSTPSEYHLRLAGNGVDARAWLLCERYPRHATEWAVSVELAYALALAEDPSLPPDPDAIRTALAPATASALAAVDVMYRPLDEAAHAVTDLPPAEVHRRMDTYLARAATPAGVPLPSAAHTIVQGRQPDPLSDYGDPRGHGLAWARSILAHQLR
ncbi:hypothetical protein ABZV92_18760 [Streptomyces rubiginosohelvolus]|uniref:hypothetical protein n=1 Tax=Streptomyces rubiginosohelvolus TaxID=67362 RepID=UPI0033AACAC8